MSVDFNAAIAAKEAEVRATRIRIVGLGVRLSKATHHVERVRDLLGEDGAGVALRMGPLYAALVGAVAANGALFFAFVEWLTYFRETPWNVAMGVSLAVGAASVPLAARQGAGGRARLGLMRVTIAGLGLAVGALIARLLLARF